ARREGVTPFMLLLAVFQALLRRLSGQDDVSVGTPISGRHRVELEPLIGFFLNTLVFRVDQPGDPSFRALLARVRALCLEAFSHQDLPFERLVDELQPKRSLSHSPLFQVHFVLLHEARDQVPVAGAGTSPHVSSAKFDLTLAVRVDGEDRISGGLTYKSD